MFNDIPSAREQWRAAQTIIVDLCQWIDRIGYRLLLPILGESGIAPTSWPDNSGDSCE